MTQTPRLALTAVALATVMALSACGKQEQSAGNSAAPAATAGDPAGGGLRGLRPR